MSRKRLQDDHSRKLYTSDEIRDLGEEGKEPSGDILVRKHFTSEIKAPSDPDSREVRFIISTEANDREGDVIRASGWEMDNFKKNPVVLFAHDSRRPPVGKASGLEVKGKKLMASAEFMSDEVDTSGFSDMIFRMVKGGFLNATSVGFSPIEWKFIRDDKEDFITGIDFVRNELLEFSVVPVPANPEALVVARDAGINLHPLEEWFEEALDTWAEHKDCLLIPRKKAESWYNITKEILRPKSRFDKKSGDASDLLSDLLEVSETSGLDEQKKDSSNSEHGQHEGDAMTTKSKSQETEEETKAQAAKESEKESEANTATSTESEKEEEKEAKNEGAEETGDTDPAKEAESDASEDSESTEEKEASDSEEEDSSELESEKDAGASEYKFTLDIQKEGMSARFEMSGPDAEVIQGVGEKFFESTNALTSKKSEQPDPESAENSAEETKEADSEEKEGQEGQEKTSEAEEEHIIKLDDEGESEAEASAETKEKSEGDADETLDITPDDLVKAIPELVKGAIKNEMDRIRGKVE